jgi:phosphate:Na+ symporter
VTLLAGYHTAFNVVGVLVLLPVIDKFTRFVERILPERSSPLTRCLDPAALASPIVAVEAVRRTVARALGAVCRSLDTTLAAASRGETFRPEKKAASEAAEALRQAQVFISDVDGPPESDDEQQRLTSTLHSLDHASRLAETAGQEVEFGTVNTGSEDVRAAHLCADAMRHAASIADEVAASPTARYQPAPMTSRRNPPGSPDPDATVDEVERSTEDALARLEHSAKALRELQGAHRIATLSAVANGALTAGEAIVRVDTVRRLEAFAYHAWRSATQLVGRAA